MLPGDLIGVYDANATGGAVGYLHSHEAMTRGFDVNKRSESDPIQVGDQIQFDSLPYPQVRALAAYTVDGKGLIKTAIKLAIKLTIKLKT